MATLIRVWINTGGDAELTMVILILELYFDNYDKWIFKLKKKESVFAWIVLNIYIVFF